MSIRRVSVITSIKQTSRPRSCSGGSPPTSFGERTSGSENLKLNLVRGKILLLLFPFTHAGGRLVPEKQWPACYSESNVTAATKSKKRLRKLSLDMTRNQACLFTRIAVFDSFIFRAVARLAPSQQSPWEYIPFLQLIAPTSPVRCDRCMPVLARSRDR